MNHLQLEILSQRVSEGLEVAAEPGSPVVFLHPHLVIVLRAASMVVPRAGRAATTT